MRKQTKKKNLFLSPHAASIGRQNPKDYPFFAEVLDGLQNAFHVVQLGREGEEIVPHVNEVCFDLPLGHLVRRLKAEAALVVSVDNAIQHLCWRYKIPCLCIFSKSDPKIFGHKENTNLLKDRKHLSRTQFNVWLSQDVDMDSFIDAPKIVAQILTLVSKLPRR